jgi:hypothetical protein
VPASRTGLARAATSPSDSSSGKGGTVAHRGAPAPFTRLHKPDAQSPAGKSTSETTPGGARSACRPLEGPDFICLAVCDSAGCELIEDPSGAWDLPARVPHQAQCGSGAIGRVGVEGKRSLRHGRGNVYLETLAALRHWLADRGQLHEAPHLRRRESIASIALQRTSALAARG